MTHDSTGNMTQRDQRDGPSGGPSFVELQHNRGLFEKEALEVTLEGRVSLMVALAARIREVSAGLMGHPRVRDMESGDKASLRDAVNDAGNLAQSLNSFAAALLDQEPTRAGRERTARNTRPVERDR